ncbi:Hypothetical protein NATL1_01081 [Prochlorococcus marinus str. NATL1A]|uniref:Helix-hairpin-helix domain-containing protein n=2 Tax=Prochlorococcus marinus TaxID=1219 RepID=A2BZL2_PROM1|nr:Hypothetical protein NATL1_01081 [Prochlorococcus marinus str. NATL1A]
MIIQSSKENIYTCKKFFLMHINNMISKKMLIKKILLNTKRNLFNVLSIFKQQKGELSDRCENLTSIPGIGTKNCNNFYEAGYMTPESIISASDEELLTIPGVGISFVKKLRKTLGRI